MSTKIRLKRFGSKKRPFYRIVVMDSRAPRDGRALEEVGVYHPISADAEAQVRFDEEKVKAWLQKGARPTNTVRKLLNNNNVTVK
ncbi:30S ribosomal protein S16 [Alkalispirochaeta sphaeroplastigenens]|uniref:Small ribosomal subunit protein bS16 n=1 Tax=Alkalispirochaeta sphaeroplastigenens TaxID=1187066 RepID=A0A2S4JTG5_9SPIO|nr:MULTISPECIES: 30S ribosomal protein S16 [Alkalispirochaeta]POR02815.1 30S ribosomal protein S16 [Alkalispirochaeta sphaeroplastigenens]